MVNGIAMVNSSVESGMFAEGALMDAGFRADMREMLQPSERPDKRPQLKDSELRRLRISSSELIAPTVMQN